MSAVDLTKCQRGDLLTLRDGRDAVVISLRPTSTLYPITISAGDSGVECVQMSGRVYDDHQESQRDVVAIIHPTRAELEEQRRELLEACKAFLQKYDEDIYDVDMLPYIENIGVAVDSAGATHE